MCTVQRSTYTSSTSCCWVWNPEISGCGLGQVCVLASDIWGGAWNEICVLGSDILVNVAGFPKLPEEVEIQPGGGFGQLDPGEARDLEVAFRPALSGSQHFAIRCVAQLGPAVRVACCATPVQPSLRLSHNVIKVRTLASVNKFDPHSRLPFIRMPALG